MIDIGNAPCSWGVEFADDPRNPPWARVLQECAGAGYRGIELGPVGYMPRDPDELAGALDQNGLTLIGGVVFRPFHDPAKWADVIDGAERTCKTLVAHGARHLVLIDSISPLRAPTAGRPDEAVQMDAAEWTAFRNRIETVARMGAENYGLTVSVHPHAAGFIDFEAEIERLLAGIDPAVLKLCLDTGHAAYAGFDPVAFLRRHIDRVAYVHFKDIDPVVRARAIANRTGFYDACGQGIFCNLGRGMVDFQGFRQVLLDAGFSGWATVEQDCDPTLPGSPMRDAQANRDYLQTIGF
jgi:inosose dehydratase